MSIRMQLNFLVLLSLIYYGSSIAAVNKQVTKTAPVAGFPNGCKVTGFGFEGSELMLNETGEQTLYLIRNRANISIELQRHETRDVFMSPPLLASIFPNNAATFASDVANLRFKCYKQEKDNTALANCQDVLDVCQYSRAKFAVSNMGNYWVSVNKPLKEVVSATAKSGIWLYWR